MRRDRESGYEFHLLEELASVQSSVMSRSNFENLSTMSSAEIEQKRFIQPYFSELVSKYGVARK
jgi:hypothetical protein